MNKLLKGTALFVTGLGVSIVIGWWLKTREQGQTLPFTSSTSDLPLDVSPDSLDMADVLGNIPLPLEAFEETPSSDSDEMVITSETIADNGVIVPFDVVDEDSAASKDDLTQINGIGPKTAEVLTGLGIASFQDLATADAQFIKDHVSRVSVAAIQDWIQAAQERA